MNYKIVLGKDINEEEFVLDLNKTPNILLCGSTGGGKSFCLKAILFSLLSQDQDADYIIIDPKGVDFNAYKDVERVHYFNSKNLEVAVGVLNGLHENNKESFVFIDELLDVAYFDKKPFQKAILKLLENQSNSKVHLLIACLAPWWKAVKAIKTKMPNRLCFYEPCLADSLSLIGRGGCEKLIGKGDCIAKIDGKITHFQAYKPNPELRDKILKK